MINEFILLFFLDLCSFNKAFSNENSQLVSAATSSTPMTTEISSLEDSTFKVGKLSVEQRKEKIHRYMKKRNERNFSKKIKVHFQFSLIIKQFLLILQFLPNTLLMF